MCVVSCERKAKIACLLLEVTQFYFKVESHIHFSGNISATKLWNPPPHWNNLLRKAQMYVMWTTWENFKNFNREFKPSDLRVLWVHSKYLVLKVWQLCSNPQIWGFCEYTPNTCIHLFIGLSIFPVVLSSYSNKYVLVFNTYNCFTNSKKMKRTVYSCDACVTVPQCLCSWD